MLRDVGARDAEFIETGRDIRRRLLGLYLMLNDAVRRRQVASPTLSP